MADEIVLAPPFPSPWSGSLGLGYTGTGGNSSTNSVNSAANLSYKKDLWNHTAKLNTLFSESNGKTSGERFAFTEETRYLLKDLDFLFFRFSYIYDKFNIFDITTSSAVGFGKTLYKDALFTLNLQAGPGYRDARVAGTNYHQHQVVGYIGGLFRWVISPTANLQQTLNIEAGGLNTATISETTLSMEIIGNLGMDFSFGFTHNTTIPPHTTLTSTTDYRTAVSLLYHF
jgi:putative salt-induced outer membrane protein